jgi:hypothetical protein
MNSPLAAAMNGESDKIALLGDELLPKEDTPEQRRAHVALYGEGGFSSWERTLQNAARENKSIILGNALLELANATNLCQANFGTLSLCEGDAFSHCGDAQCSFWPCRASPPRALGPSGSSVAYG